MVIFGGKDGIRKEQTQGCDGVAIATAVAVNRVHILFYPSLEQTKKREQGEAGVALFVAERMGFEPMCRGYRQPHFECGSLQPLRYLSEYLNIIHEKIIKRKRLIAIKGKSLDIWGFYKLYLFRTFYKECGIC